MSKLYTATFSNVSISTTQDFFEIVPAATGIVIVHKIELGQVTSVGDANEDVWIVSWRTGMTTSGFGGASITPVPVLFGDAAAEFTAERNNTTLAGGGTIINHLGWAWNLRIPFEKTFLPEERPVLNPLRRGVLTILTTPDGVRTVDGKITLEEIN